MVSDTTEQFESIPKIIKLDEIMSKYKLGLASVELIHILGAEKYPLFSWYNTPETSDAIPVNCINAMYRHLIRINLDLFARDAETKIYHFMHLACRCAMLIGVLYKLCARSTQPLFLAESDQPIQYGSLLAPSEIEALGYFDASSTKLHVNLPEAMNNTKAVLGYIRNQIYAILPIVTLNKGETFNCDSVLSRYEMAKESSIFLFGVILTYIGFLFKKYPDVYDTLEDTLRARGNAKALEYFTTYF